VAVLPFDNLSTDPEMEFFSDGVSEEIIQRLSRGANLKVIGRTSSFQFRGEGYFLPVSSYQSNKGVPAAPIGQSLPRISLSTRNEIGRNARAASTSPKMALMRDSNPNVSPTMSSTSSSNAMKIVEVENWLPIEPVSVQ
jgi:hypothetical protein